MKKTKTLTIAEERCKECGLCIFYCNDKALTPKNCFNSKGYHPIQWSGECSFCGRCYLICPDNVIEIHEK